MATKKNKKVSKETAAEAKSAAETPDSPKKTSTARMPVFSR